MDAEFVIGVLDPDIWWTQSYKTIELSATGSSGAVLNTSADVVTEVLGFESPDRIYTSIALPLRLIASHYEGGLPRLPVPTLSAQALSGGIVTGPALRIQGFATTGTMIAGSAASDSNIVLSPLALTADMAGNAAIALDALALTGEILHGALAEAANLRLAGLALEASGFDGEANALRALLPLQALQLTATALTGSAGQFAAGLPALRVTGAGVPGRLGEAAFTLAALGLQADAFTVAQINSGAISIPIALPAFSLRALRVEQALALVLNARNAGVTTYSNWPFNSFARIGSHYYAAGPDGIYLLEGATDDGAEIEAVVRLPISDFGARVLKRVAAAYVGYRSSGPIELRLNADDGDWNVYTMDESRGTGIYRNRVKAGRGVKGNYWQAEVRNLRGADFQIDKVELEAIALSRKTA